MNDGAWTVVKVGGSLFDWPELRGRLRAWLERLDANNVLLVPGGGATAEAIRALDRTHLLGEETSHWLALRALSVNACFLQTLLPEAALVSDFAYASGSENGRARWGILDALPFLTDDETRLGRLPHAWDVTSDSIAVRAAILSGARELILLKSIAWEGSDWAVASRAGVVDEHFDVILRQAPHGLRVRVVNLRQWS